jgi:hypothetical protein
MIKNIKINSYKHVINNKKITNHIIYFYKKYKIYKNKLNYLKKINLLKINHN